MDYRDDLCSLFGHVHQIFAYSVGEFDAVDHVCWADYVRDVGNGCAEGCTLLPGLIPISALPHATEAAILER